MDVNKRFAFTAVINDHNSVLALSERNFLNKHSALYSFILNNNVYIRCCNSTLTDVHFTVLLSKEHLTNRQITFTCLESVLSQLCCLKFSFKFVQFSTSYSRKYEGMYIVKMVYINIIGSWYTCKKC